MIRYYFVFISLTIFSLNLQGQTKQEQLIIQLMNDFNQAIINIDSASLNTLVWDELSYGHSSGLIQSKADFISGVLNGANRFKKFDLQNQTVEVNGRTAVLRHVAIAQAVNKGKQVVIKFGNILIWQKRKGVWKLLARQGYKI